MYYKSKNKLYDAYTISITSNLVMTKKYTMFLTWKCLIIEGIGKNTMVNINMKSYMQSIFSMK